MKKIFLLVFIIIIFKIDINAQENKEYLSIRTNKKVKIDGYINDESWSNAAVLSNFVEYSPNNGVNANNKTEVKIIYDDDAIYVSAKMFDKEKSSIKAGYSERDKIVNADWFSLSISPFNNGLNYFEFIVTASNIQSDCKVINESKDFSWNAVWQSAVKITDDLWTVEIKIPYSAIRFPSKSEQIWGLNIKRYKHTDRHTDSWNFIDKNQRGEYQQNGTLKGIKNVKMPFRLSVSPYTSFYIKKKSNSSKFSQSIKGGLDLKYGINESFTLDMMLIPDFGQVQEDDKVLNLSPFELKYNEKRQFFIEGNELFNKCGVFYSKRIGEIPDGYNSVANELDTNEKIEENPIKTDILNAMKISGRNKKGLGIGFFNAITKKTNAEIIDTITNKRRKIETQVPTNYNIIVIDKILKNNSFISFINLNTSKYKYSANITGTELSIQNKKGKYKLNGYFNLSQIYSKYNSPNLGHRYYFNFAKIKGNFRFDISQTETSNSYEVNDIGFLNRNDQISNNLSFNYNIYTPFWRLLSWTNKARITYNRLYSNDKYENSSFYFSSSCTTDKYLSLTVDTHIYPQSNDYYEARKTGQIFVQEQMQDFMFWFSSDYRKMIALDGYVKYKYSNKYNLSSYHIRFAPRIRPADKVLIIYSIDNTDTENSIGFVSNSNDEIIFGKRAVNTMINTINATYIINNKMNLNFRLRHYFSNLKYNKFYELEKDGFLNNGIEYTDNANVNYNSFNIDFSYTWYFLPGSELSLMWKQAIDRSEDLVDYNIFDNFNETINAEQFNTLSLKILYFIDYNSVKKTIKKRS